MVKTATLIAIAALLLLAAQCMPSQREVTDRNTRDYETKTRQTYILVDVVDETPRSYRLQYNYSCPDENRHPGSGVCMGVQL